MSLAHLIHDAVAVLPAQDPGPFDEIAPRTPPGFRAIQQIVGYVQWVAGASIVGLFFGGIIAATAGRLWDHHGSGRLGARMIVGSLALAVLFGLGYTLISQFAGASA
jgi:MFS family permease